MQEDYKKKREGLANKDNKKKGLKCFCNSVYQKYFEY